MQLNIAAIGSGGKGASDISNAARNGSARVGALCDVDFSGSAAATAKKFPEAKCYADLIGESSGTTKTQRVGLLDARL